VTSSGTHGRSPAARRQPPRPDEPVLTSKLAPPVIPGWIVPRERIANRVAEGARGPLTVVTGPPGAGKTIAVASWAAADRPPGPVAWVTLDEYDNRPRVFWSYVLAGLRRAGVVIPRTVWASARGGAVDLGFILRLASAIVAQGAQVRLILDDLHLVTDSRCLNGLARLLRNARPLLHIVAASRSDPLLPLHRYRLAGELTEIRAGELAFTVDEAAVLMAHHGITLPGDSLEFLTERAEGWVAALRLAAISMKNDPQPEQFVKELVAEDSPVASYLVEEILNAQSADVRNLLLKTSILDRVSADIAGELTDLDNAGGALAALAQGNALVQPLHNGWYRYHPLLAEVLRLKLQRERPRQVAQLRRRAAQWLRRHGRLTEAARHAAKAPDWQLATRMVVDEMAVGRLLDPHDSEPLAGVLTSMPDGLEWTAPHPLLVRAALLLPSGPSDEVSASLAAADRMLKQLGPDDEIPSRLAAATIRLALSHRSGDLGAAKAAAAEALMQLERVPADLLEAHPEVRPQIMADVGLVEFWSGRFDQAAGTFAAAAAVSRRPFQRADCLGNLALVEALRGRLRHAAELAQEAAGAARGDQAQGGEHISRAAMIARAYVHLERNELPEARRQLKNAELGPRAWPERLVTAVACLVAARGCLAEGRPAAAWEIVGRAVQGWSPAPWLGESLALVESHACAVAGDIAGALTAAKRAAGGSPSAAAAAQARAWLAAGEARAARDALATGSPATGTVPDRVRLEVSLVEGHVCVMLGDRPRARHALEQAFRLAEGEQVRLPFALERAWLVAALRDANLSCAYRDLLDPGSAVRPSARPRLMAARKPALIPAPLPGGRQERPVVVEKLSEREREVLQHVSEMLNTTEIASVMYVSGNTVKSHLKSAFRKLGVASRNEAVRRARELELI
jgi:LuxR family transcriptional regulator, maltose regulon positive regulatory protein